MNKLVLKFIFSKYFAWILCIGLVSLLYYNYSHPKVKEVLIQPSDVNQVDSCTYQSTVETVTKDTYDKMHDSLITKIKNLQSELKIKTKDIHSAIGVGADISDSVVGHLELPETPEPVLTPLSDSLVINYNDPWTYIHAEGRLSKPDSILINYKVISFLSLQFYRLWKKNGRYIKQKSRSPAAPFYRKEHNYNHSHNGKKKIGNKNCCFSSACRDTDKTYNIPKNSNYKACLGKTTQQGKKFSIGQKHITPT